MTPFKEICATRSLGVLFTVADQAIVPAPVPEAPEDIVNQDESLTAARLQLELVAVMAMVPVLAVAVMAWDEGARVNPQAGFCVTLKLAVPIWIEPVLDVEFGLAS